ncbi:MAG: triphosphoribosyl-dephospho-CoA synthase [Betaproteobacteria bacterium]|nr:triphosphoribosyl-dephospho-CoA synthase [Betaproteobacteria bacterium]
MLTESAVAQAFVRACELDVEAIKPGNVSWAAAGHGMRAEDFLRSAAAAAPAIADSRSGVGERVLNAVRATRGVCDCNTNLGILLLCAPLAASITRTLPDVLAGLTVTDAKAAFEAICLAAPGGLGESSAHDVRRPPSIGLREAMAAAADRDTIARQYAGDFDDIRHWGLDRLRSWLDRGTLPVHAMTLLYLAWLCRVPDTHVARKHGLVVATQLTDEAGAMVGGWGQDHYPGDAALLAWDGSLKRRGINPGSTADLCVATWFALYLEDGHKTG